MKLKSLLFITCASLLIGCSSTPPILGLVDGALISCPDSPNCVNSQVSTTDDSKIEPIMFDGTVDNAKARILEVLKSEDNSVVIEVKSNYVYAEYVSSVFRFVDDAEFYILDDGLGRAIIHVRSASRTGHSDFGVNRDRIERIRAKISQ